MYEEAFKAIVTLLSSFPGAYKMEIQDLQVIRVHFRGEINSKIKFWSEDFESVDQLLQYYDKSHNDPFTLNPKVMSKPKEYNIEDYVRKEDFQKFKKLIIALFAAFGLVFFIFVLIGLA